MNINTSYRKYKINKLNLNGDVLYNTSLLIDNDYEGFFIGLIREDVEANPLNMDRILTFYHIRKSDIEAFKNELENIREINANLIELQINLQLNSSNFIYRR